MEQPPTSAPHGFLVRPSHALDQTRVLAEIRPALTAAIDILELQTGFLKVSGQAATRGGLSREPSQCVHAFGPSRRHCGADISEHDLGGYPIELHVAACRQERKARLNLLYQRLTRSPQQCLEAPVKPKLPAMVSDEVEHRANGLPDTASQAPPQLLQKQCRAIRWT